MNFALFSKKSHGKIEPAGLDFLLLDISCLLQVYEEGSHGLREYQMEKDKEVKHWFGRYLKN